jgi:transcriptional regulator with XRE-family HTH domain
MPNNVGSDLIIHANIRFMREKDGLTQEQVADYLNMSVNGYGDIERGETDIKFSRLMQISNLFDITIAELVTQNIKNIEQSVPKISLQHHISLSKNFPNNQYVISDNTEMYKLIIELKDNEIQLLKKLIILLESRQ